MMKSSKSRLLMVFTMLTVVLVITVPAMAEDIDVDVECEADRGYCAKHVSQEVWQEDTDENTGSEPQEDVFQELVDEVSDQAPVDELSEQAPVNQTSEQAPVNQTSDQECSERFFPPCGYYWPWLDDQAGP